VRPGARIAGVAGGVAAPQDGIDPVLAGADVVQIVSALLRHGPAYVTVMGAQLAGIPPHGVAGRARRPSATRPRRIPRRGGRANHIRTLPGLERQVVPTQLRRPAYPAIVVVKPQRAVRGWRSFGNFVGNRGTELRPACGASE
jgi:hypothetical protein